MVQLNLVRNVNSILDSIGQELSASKSFDDDLDGIRSLPVNIPAQFPEQFQRWRSHLGSLRKVQRELEGRLGAASTEVDNAGDYDPSLGLAAAADRKKRGPQEFVVNSNNGWKSALNRVRPLLPGGVPDFGPGRTMTGKDEAGEMITAVIAGCREDMISLWANPVVRNILRRNPSQIEDTPGL